MNVTVERDSIWAPCSYLIVQVGASTRDEDKTVLVQMDWSFPGLASNLGYVPCSYGDTDGTVDCAHHTASEMIDAARDFLDAHLGVPFDDPGYFEIERGK
jgi:hypothetical protein